MQKKIWKQNISTCMFESLICKRHQNENLFMRIFITILLFTVFSFTGAAQEPNKVALIVAISKYPSSLGWGELSSVNDVKLIKDALLRQGFKEQNIKVLTDKQATYAGMKAAFDRDLIQKVKPGDIAVFHFSGHGEQIEDDNGDEADGLDESLIPYDAPINDRGGPDNHFRDDLLGKKLNELRTVLGVNGSLLFIADACHSGTLTRGLGIKRGTSEIYASAAFKSKQSKIHIIQDNSYGIAQAEKNMAPMACFFACSPSECNSEAVLPDKTGVGSLSLAFSRALANADKNISYRALFDNIKVEMSSIVVNQTPLAEGDLDYTIFGGKALGKPLYYQVVIDPKTKILSLPTGKIYGIFNNTTLKLYKADTRDTASARPIAYGTITDAGDYTSTITLDKKLPDAEIKSAWVYFNEVNYGDLAVKLKLNIADNTFKNEVAGLFSNIKQVSLVDNGANLFLQSGMNQYSPDSLYLVNNGEMVIWKTDKLLNKQKLYDSLAIKIGDYARSAYLRNLSLTNDEYKVSFQFVPLKCIADCGTRSVKYQDDKLKNKMDSSGNIIFKDGDAFRLNIISQSDSKRLYYTVLDIQPDNVVNVLLPRRRDTPEDYIISAGDTSFLRQAVFTISPPYGVDVIKIIASESPLDLRNIFSTRGIATRGAAQGPFGKILQGTFNAEGNRTRGSNEAVIQPDAVNIMTVPFHIVRNGEGK